PLRATAMTSARNSAGKGFGTILILPARTNPHRSGVNRTGGSPKSNVPVLERLRRGPATLSIDEAAEILGISRGFAYAMAKSGDLPVIRLSSTRMRVPTAKLLAMLEGEDGTPADQGGAE
ncbi:helix-turn-helix domain-containing protein, partial [Mycobacterium paragordonae]|uniref:helix-turn-helix domain-containing protein n=1 Tax=Mycobacterium paragordonae TaxID=1389713 RepID=UPI001E4D878E